MSEERVHATRGPRWSKALGWAAISALLIVPACGPAERTTQPGEETLADEAATEESTAIQEPGVPGDADIQEESLPAERAGSVQKSASVTLEARSGSNLSGTAVFEERDGVVHIKVALSGIDPGDHGVHIHDVGDCSAPDAKSAGGHFNPTGSLHGAPDAPEHHAGDLGNIAIGEDGRGTLEITSSELSLGDRLHSVMGRAVVVHEKADDLRSQPSGAAGARIGCGEIR